MSDGQEAKGPPKRAGLREVAAEAGVSMMSVSRALNGTGRISAETRGRVLQAAQRVGYRPSVTARALRSNETRLIGVSSPNLMMPLHIEITLGAKDVLAADGYRVLLTVDPADDLDVAAPLIDGELILGSATIADSEGRGVDPMRTVALMGSASADIDTCSSDLETAALHATRHLVSRGYRRIGVLQLLRSPSEFGYRRALEEHGESFDPSLVVTVGNDERTVRTGVSTLLAREPAVDAVFVAGVAATPLALKAIRRLEFSVPRDLGFVGTENSRSEYGDLLNPGMTAIRVPGYEIGAAGARRLLQRLRGDTSPPQRIDFPAELVIRDSTPGPGQA